MVIEREQHGGISERGFAYPSHKEKRRLDEPRHWLATKQNLARLCSIDQRGEEEQEQEQRRKLAWIWTKFTVFHFFYFLFYFFFYFYF